MAQFFLGTLSVPAATGTQTIGGIGFQPKVVLFFTTLQSAEGDSADTALCLGWAAAPGGCAVGTSSQHNVNPSNTDRAQSPQHCLRWRDPVSDSITFAADLQSFDANSFTLNWTAVVGNVYVHFLAIGGAEVQAAHGQFAMPTTTGNFSVTRLGFQPDVVLFQSERSTTATTYSATETYLGWGVGRSSTARWATASGDWNGQTNPENGRRQDSTACVLLTNVTGGTVRWKADLVSLDADGFTLNFSTVQTTAEYCQYLALKGLRVAVGSLNAPTSSGTQAVTGLGFRPEALVLCSTWVASGTSSFNRRHSWGVATGPTNRRALWIGAENVAAGAATIARRWHASNRVLANLVPAASGSTIDAKADLASFDPDGFTLNWIDPVSTSVPVFYLALASATFSVSATETAALSASELGVASLQRVSSEAQTLLGSESLGVQAQSSTGEAVTLPVPGESPKLSLDQVGERLPWGLVLPTTTSAFSVSGKVLTDQDRNATVPAHFDGRAPESSVGIWRGTTNLVTNGSVETNLNGWVAVGATISRDTSQAYHGAASLKVVTYNAGTGEGVRTADGTGGMPVTAGQPYTASAWAWGSGTVRIELLWYDSTGAFITWNTGTAVVLSSVPQRLALTATAPSDASYASVRILTTTQQAATFWVDAVQFEQSAFPTPYAHTNGAAASRAGPVVKIEPATVNALLTPAQGWVALRARPGIDYLQFPVSSFLFPFSWRNTLTGPRITLHFWRKTVGLDLVMESKQGESAQIYTANFNASSVTAGQSFLAIGAWTASQLKVSLNGGAFTTGARSGVPDLSAVEATVGGYWYEVASGYLQGELLWIACGTGTLTDADAAALAALGDNKPTPKDFPSSASLTMLWTCADLVYGVYSERAQVFPVTQETWSLSAVENSTISTLSFMALQDTCLFLAQEQSGTAAWYALADTGGVLVTEAGQLECALGETAQLLALEQPQSRPDLVDASAVSELETTRLEQELVATVAESELSSSLAVLTLHSEDQRGG